MGKNIIEKIESLMPSLTKVQKLIAVSIIQDPLSASFYSIKELAEKACVSHASIARFARQITNEGYPQLQSELQTYIQTISDPIKRLELNVISNTEDDRLLTQVFETQISNLQKTFNQSTIAAVAQTVKLISEAGHVYTCGSRGSHSVAYYLGHHLNRVLGNVDIIQDDDRSPDFLLRATDQDVAIFVCLPRYSERLLMVVERLKALGTKIVTINSTPRSPFVEYSDVSFYVFNRSQDFHNSLLSAMLVAEMLISSVIFRNMDQALSNLDKMEQLFDDMHQFVNPE